MSYSRPKLMLDEQSFQDMLAAAFTIQEHNAQRKKNARPPARVCSQCGAPALDDSPLCERCASEPRQGEELQRKWASLWLMSQEQGLFQKSAGDPADESPDGRLPNVEPRNLGSPAPASPNIVSQIELPAFPPRHFETPRIESGLVDLPTDKESEAPTPDLVELRRHEAFAHPDAEIDHAPLELLANDRSFNSGLSQLRILPDVTELAAEGELAPEEIAEESPVMKPWSLRDLNLKLRFHRADFYLVVAIAVSTFAMVWVLSATPAPGAHQKPRLRPWERAMVSLGLAEAPEAPPRRGNPSVSVWVDPKTALYYCAGEELYGKAPGGHVATQRDAQLDQFEPAGRAPCE
ncbi:MAG: hypothetical protein HY010_06395 [Acidobacteria bacterium]|nr:hypothetical protein [Acidobacteriota bacterium]